MRNNTIDDINDFDINCIRYDTSYLKGRNTDASRRIKFDTNKEKDNSDLPQPITDEFNVLQPETSYSPYSGELPPAHTLYAEYDTSDEKETNNSHSITDTQNDFSSPSLPITNNKQFDVIYDNNLSTTPSKIDTDIPFEIKDTSLNMYTENIGSNDTTDTESEEVVITSTTKVKVTKIPKIIKISPKVKFTNKLPKGNKLAEASNISNINHKNDIITVNMNYDKSKEKGNEHTVAVYLDELLHFKNGDMQSQTSTDDNEEVVVYIDDELRSTTQSSINRDYNRNPVAWIDTLKYALNFIATKSRKMKADKTLPSLHYNEISSDLMTNLEQYRITEGFNLESSTVAYDYKSTKEKLPITDEMSSNNVKVFRRIRDIKSIDFDIQSEIKGIQDENKNDFNKRIINKSSTAKLAVFSDYIENICSTKDFFSSVSYNNLRDKRVSNKDPENKAAQANTDKIKNRIKRSPDTETTLQTEKTALDPQLTTQPEITVRGTYTSIYNLTTESPLKEGKRVNDLNVKQLDITGFFHMVSEWFGTLAGVTQLNKTDPV